MAIPPKMPRKQVAKKTARRAARKTANLNELSIHPLLNTLPIMDEVVARLAKDAKGAKGGQFADKHELHEEARSSWLAFVADIKERGVVEPLAVVLVDKQDPLYIKGIRFQIVDGRHRFTGACEAGLRKFPYKVVKEDPATFILGALAHRNHFNKQQRAFFALHLHPELVENSQGKRTDLELPQSLGKFASKEALAESIGVGIETMNIAARVHVLFLKDPAARKKYLPLIFAGSSLQGILSGDGAEKSNHGGGDTRLLPWMRLRESFAKHGRSVEKDWLEVQAAGAEAQAEVKQAFSAFLHALPPALREHAVLSLAQSDDANLKTVTA
jgi:hypothetical protein